MSGSAAYRHDAPARAFFSRDDRKAYAAGARHGKPTGFGDEVVAAHLFGDVFGQPPGAVAAEGLLVGHADEEEVALGAESLVGEMAESHGHGSREVQHVHRPAAPHLAV